MSAGSAAPGTYTLTVTGIEGTSTHSTTVTLTVPSNDFSIGASPTSLTLNPGGSGTSTISTAVRSGVAGTINLSVSGAPSGASASLSPTSVPAGGSSTLTVGSGSAAPGTYTLTITGTEGSMTHSTTVALTVAKAATRLVATPVFRGGVSARLTRSDTGAPLGSQPIVFTALGVYSCTATTNPQGVATCPNLGLDALLGNGYQASFRGTSVYLPSSASAGLF